MLKRIKFWSLIDQFIKLLLWLLLLKMPLHKMSCFDTIVKKSDKNQNSKMDPFQNEVAEIRRFFVCFFLPYPILCEPLHELDRPLPVPTQSKILTRGPASLTLKLVYRQSAQHTRKFTFQFLTYPANADAHSDNRSTAPPSTERLARARDPSDPWSPYRPPGGSIDSALWHQWRIQAPSREGLVKRTAVLRSLEW